QSHEWQAYRFSTGTGSFRKFICVSGEQREIDNLQAALLYALTGKQDSMLVEVALQLGDDAGNTWVIHRSGSNVGYLKNGSPLDSSDGRELFGAVLDIDPEDAE